MNKQFAPSTGRKTKAKPSKAADVPSGRRPRETIELGDLAGHAGTYLRMFSRYMNSGVDEIMEAHPVGPGQGKTSALQIIAHNPGISQIELSDIFGRDRSAQFRITADLEKRGLIRREADPGERRRQMLFVTDAGRKLVAGLEKIAHENEERVFSVLSPEDYATFRRILATLWKSTLQSGSGYWPDFTDDEDERGH